MSEKKRTVATIAVVVIASLMVLTTYLVSKHYDEPNTLPTGPATAHQVPPITTLNDSAAVEGEQGELAVSDSTKVVREAIIAPGATFSHVLATQLDFSGAQIHRLAEAVRPIFNLRRINAGTKVRTTFNEKTDAEGEVTAEPVRVAMKINDRQTLVVTNLDQEKPDAMIEEAVITTATRAYAGSVNYSLWTSATSAGMDPAIISSMAEIFAWQIDFNREVRTGDQWRLVVEEVFANGKPIGFGDIISAEYVNGGFSYVAVKYELDDRVQYFQPDGNSLRRMFLKSPLKFGRITSRFQAKRFHPVLKIDRPHLGVDYGAPTGTPVMSVGDGVVAFAGTRGASGKMITIRHNSTYRTEYKHLSRFSENIRPGSKVSMGQTIGYVGATGLATGPHLHFEFHVGSQVVDPQGLKFPHADPVPEQHLPDFKVRAEASLAQLPPWNALVISRKDGD